MEHVRNALKESMRTILKWFSIVLLLAPLSCGTLLPRNVVYDSQSPASQPPPDGSIQSVVDHLAEPLIDSGETLGIAIGVIDTDGTIHHFCYGLLASESLPAQTNIFQVGSLAKLFVASMLAVLVDEGTLAYEDTIGSILPPDIPLAPHVDSITLYELMAHTAGFAREPRGLTPLLYLLKYSFTGENIYGYFDVPFLYKYLASCSIKPREERSYLYSNTGIALLTHLIEIKTGRSVSELMKEKITDPLHMHDTVLYLNPEQAERLVQGHAGDVPKFVRRHTPLPPWDMGDPMRNAGGLYASMDDLLIFAKAHMGMMSHSLEPILSSTLPVRVKADDAEYALGWVVGRLNDGRGSIHYKNGVVAGYRSYIGLNVQKQTAVVVLYSNFNWDDKIGHNLLLHLSRKPDSDAP